MSGIHLLSPGPESSKKRWIELGFLSKKEMSNNQPCFLRATLLQPWLGLEKNSHFSTLLEGFYLAKIRKCCGLRRGSPPFILTNYLNYMFFYFEKYHQSTNWTTKIPLFKCFYIRDILIRISNSDIFSDPDSVFLLVF